MPSLLDPIVVGDLRLLCRVIMAPSTRLRATTADHVPTPLMRDCYVQRASAGLIISEGIAISPQAVGYACVKGLWNEAPVSEWREITAGVHAGGRIFAQ